MRGYQKEALSKLKAMHAFIAAHPDCMMVMLCAHFKQPASTLRTPLLHLVNGGHIDVMHGKRSQGGQAPNQYTATDKGAPAVLPSRQPYGEKTGRMIADPTVKRIIRPAKQIGMHRCELECFLFGVAGAVA